MANFKVVFRSDNQGADTAPGWEPGCPLLINAVQVSRNTDTGQCFLQLKLSNVSDEIVSSYKLQVDVAYADGTTETVDLRPLDADIRPVQTCRPDPVPLSGSDILSATTRVITVSQPNGSWRTASAAEPIPVGKPLELEQFAAIERKRLLVDLGKDPDDYDCRIVEGDGWWVCTGGIPNVNRDTCCACGLSRDMLKNLENEAYLHAKAEERKTIEEAKNRRKRRRNVFCALLCIVIAIVAACISLAYLAIEPYLNATQLQEQGSYKTAYEEYTALGTLLDSEERARECARLAGDRAASVGDYVDAQAWYERAGNVESRERAAEAIQESEETTEELRRAADSDPALGLAFHQFAASSTPENAGTSRFSLALYDNGTCHVTYTIDGDGKIHDSEGTWSLGTDCLFTVDLPDFKGAWTATRGEQDAQFLLRNRDDESLTLLFDGTQA